MRFNHGHTDTYDFQHDRHYYRASALRYAPPRRQTIEIISPEEPPASAPASLASSSIDQHLGSTSWPSADSPQTVEDLLRDGYFAPPAGEPEVAMIQDRRLGTGMALGDLIGQAQQRVVIYEQNRYDLLRAECDAFNELAREGWPARPEQHALYERRMQDLASERRMERVHLWRDLSRLRLGIPEAVGGYLQAYRSGQLLGDLDDDAPEYFRGSGKGDPLG
ncbi:MAG: hypothetical protein AAGH88_08950 [Planctomycetota bacterium]